MAAPTRYAFSVEEWHQLGAVGFFDDDDRVELLDGEVMRMAPIGSRHMSCVNQLNRLLVRAVGDLAIVSIQGPLQVGPISEPVPDVVLLRPRADQYRDAIPTATDTFAVVEVADTTLAWDRDRKAPRYGAAGVPLYWIVDVASGEVLVFTEPGPRGYESQRVAEPGETLTIPGLPEVAISLTDLIG